MKTFTVHLPLDDQHLRAIGLVAAQWSFAQHALERMIWFLMGIPNDIGRRSTTEVNDMTRINIARSLAEHRMDEDSYKEFNDALTEYNSLRIQRNEVIHNLWVGHEARPVAQGLKPAAKAAYRTGRNLWSVADLNDLAEEIEQWGGECAAALEGMFLELPPRSPQQSDEA